MSPRLQTSLIPSLLWMMSSMSTMEAKIKMVNVMEMDTLSMMMEAIYLDHGFMESERDISGKYLLVLNHE